MREPKFSTAKEQDADFYKFLPHDAKPPLDTLQHLSVDAPVQFNALMFLPVKAGAILQVFI